MREGISDREKERHYVESLVNNLRDDTASLAGAIQENGQKADSLEALILLSRKSLADTAVRKIPMDSGISGGIMWLIVLPVMIMW